MFAWFRGKSRQEQRLELKFQKSESKISLVNPFLSQHKALVSIFFLVYAFLVACICFWGNLPVKLHFNLGQTARSKIQSEYDFSYTSEVLTKRLREEKKQSNIPVYSFSDEPLKKITEAITCFKKLLVDEFTSANSDESQNLAAKKVAYIMNEQHGINLNENTVLILQQGFDAKKRNRILDEGLLILKGIYKLGVYSQAESALYEEIDNPYFMNLDSQGENGVLSVQSEINALRTLRMQLWALEGDPDKAGALFYLFKQGVTSNLFYNEAETKKKLQETLKSIKSVKVKVHAGDILVDKGWRITKELREKLIHYYQFMDKSQGKDLGGFDAAFIKYFIETILLLSCGVFSLLLAYRKEQHFKRFFLMGALILIVSLFINRCIHEIGVRILESNGWEWVHLAPYLFCVFFAPFLGTIMLGAEAGIILAFLTSIFEFLMQGVQDISYFILLFFSMLIGIALLKKTCLRRDILKSIFLASGGFSLMVILYALMEHQHIWYVLLQQVLIIYFVGIITGILILGWIPLLEYLFDYATDVTLLELTDFNHPLLRRFQMMASGSFHHSVVVATLAERAAQLIQANSLLCRCFGLYHDIGKIMKPEYFTENQSLGHNPHEEKSSSISALILKSHVREGVDIAKNYRLPEVIIEAIRRHHGTSLMQYFYQKAIQEKNKAEEQGFDVEEIEESTYRYEGPKPNTKEIVILGLADAIEASSRSLSKITLQNIEEMVDTVIQVRIEDGQLDEAEITLKEIQLLRENLSTNLFNMLHARVGYGADKG